VLPAGEGDRFHDVQVAARLRSVLAPAAQLELVPQRDGLQHELGQQLQVLALGFRDLLQEVGFEFVHHEGLAALLSFLLQFVELEEFADFVVLEHLERVEEVGLSPARLPELLFDQCVRDRQTPHTVRVCLQAGHHVTHVNMYV